MPTSSNHAMQQTGNCWASRVAYRIRHEECSQQRSSKVECCSRASAPSETLSKHCLQHVRCRYREAQERIPGA